MRHAETFSADSVASEFLSFEDNPFCTRFIKPGALPFVFTDKVSRDSGAKASASLDEGLYLKALADRIIRARLATIVGPHGTGKSTLIESLMPELVGRFHCVTCVRLHAAESIGFIDRLGHARKNGQRTRTAVSSASAGALIIIDGIEQISPLDRWWLRSRALRHNQSILATSHDDISGFETLWTTTVSRSLVEYLSQRLLNDSSDRTSRLVDEAIRDREINAGTNLRDLWFDLYDIVAARI